MNAKSGASNLRCLSCERSAGLFTAAHVAFQENDKLSASLSTSQGILERHREVIQQMQARAEEAEREVEQVHELGSSQFLNS